MSGRAAARTALALFFVVAGTLHFVVPEYYEMIVPAYLPAPGVLVAVSGVAEIVGGLGLLVPRLRGVAGLWLIAVLLAVLPANVEMLRLYRSRGMGGPAEAVLWLRLPFQGLLIWWAWRMSRES